MIIKKIYLLIVTILSLSIFFGCNDEKPSEPYTLGAERYYFYGDKKITLYEIIGMYVVQLDTATNFKASLQILKENSKIAYIITLYEDDYIIKAISKLSLSAMKHQPAVINAMTAYTANPHDLYSTIYLTGELILQMKEGYSIDDVLYLFENEAVIKKVDKYNKYILQVKNWEKIFDIANALHLDDKVSFCEPNMTANIKTF